MENSLIQYSSLYKYLNSRFRIQRQKSTISNVNKCKTKIDERSKEEILANFANFGELDRTDRNLARIYETKPAKTPINKGLSHILSSPD